MKKTILTLVGIGLLVVWSAMAQTNPCIWNPWTLATAPTISVTVNSPGNQCIGTQVSVTATAATTDGTKTRTDNCGNSQTAALTLSIPTWTWSLSGITANVTSGTGSTATFTSTSAGTATVTFTATATTTDPNGTYSANNSATFTVVEVAALLPDQGCEIDDGDANPNTKTFIVCPPSPGAVNILATPNPNIPESLLPPCWSLAGGIGTGRLSRSVDRSISLPTTVTATAGSSTKSTTIVILNLNSVQYKRSDEPSTFYDANGGGDVALNETFDFRVDATPQLDTSGGCIKWDIWDEGVSPPQQLGFGAGTSFSKRLTTLGQKRVRFWVDLNGNGVPDTGECFVWTIFQVVNVTTKWITIARHVDVIFSNADGDSRCAQATALLRTRDQLDDRRCAVELRRLGNVTTFGQSGDPPGTPPAHIENSDQEAAVFAVPGTVKVVITIHYPVTAMGLTMVPLGTANSIIVQLPVNSTWAHEFGHQQGIDHYDLPEHRIMSTGDLNNSNTINELNGRNSSNNMRLTRALLVVCCAGIACFAQSTFELDKLLKRRYEHGFPYELAKSVSKTNLTRLEAMLVPPSEPAKRGTAVYILGIIGDEHSALALIRYLETTTGAISAEAGGDMDALLEVPRALGHLAASGSTNALNYLIANSDPHGWAKKDFPWTFNGRPANVLCATALASATIMALGISGTDSSEKVLSEIEKNPNLERAYRRAATEALNLLRRIRNNGRDAVFSHPTLK